MLSPLRVRRTTLVPPVAMPRWHKMILCPDSQYNSSPTPQISQQDILIVYNRSFNNEFEIEAFGTEGGSGVHDATSIPPQLNISSMWRVC